jgi:hypothetical protein
MRRNEPIDVLSNDLIARACFLLEVFALEQRYLAAVGANEAVGLKL